MDYGLTYKQEFQNNHLPTFWAIRIFSLVCACIPHSYSLTSSRVIPYQSSIQANACRWPKSKMFRMAWARIRIPILKKNYAFHRLSTWENVKHSSSYIYFLHQKMQYSLQLSLANTKALYTWAATYTMHKLLHFGLQSKHLKGHINQLIGAHDHLTAFIPTFLQGTTACFLWSEQRQILKNKNMVITFSLISLHWIITSKVLFLKCRGRDFTITFCFTPELEH